MKVHINAGFCTTLFLIFLVLKLTKVITWSWWWVFSPFWLPVVLLLAIIALLVLAKIIERL